MTRTVEDMTSFGSSVNHACAVAASDEHLWELSAAYIAAGIEAGEQVSYFDDGTSDKVLERLLDDGVGLDAPMSRGQFVVVPAEFTRAALMSPLDELEALLDEQIGAALAGGYAGLRVTGQLNHGLQRTNGVSMPDYDDLIDVAVRDKPALALCLYDRTHYPDDVIEMMRATHAVEIESSTIYDDTLLRITATGPGCARIAGEVDHSNRPQVRKLLEDELDKALRSPSAPVDIRLDLSSLRFIDVSGAVGLVHAAEEFPSSHRLVLHGVRPRIGRVLDRCGAPFAAQLVITPHPDLPIPRVAPP